MKKLIKYLKPYWKYAVLAPLFMIMEVFLDLLQPAMIKDIIDIGVANGDISYIIQKGLMMMVVAALGIFGGFMCTYFASKASLNFGADIRKEIFYKVQSLSYKNLDKLKTSNLITRITNDTSKLQMAVGMMLRFMIRTVIMAIGSLTMALMISPKLSIILLVAIPLIVGLMSYIMKRAFPYFKEVQNKLDNLNSVVQENLSAMRVIKAFVRSDYEEKRFETSNDELMETSIRASKFIMTIMPLLMFILNVSVVATLWIGGTTGSNTGEIMAFMNYIMQLLVALLNMGMVAMHISRAKASADRICELLEEEPAVEEQSGNKVMSLKGNIEFEDVVFSYGHGEPVLKNINFKIKEGETIGVLGATGAGKSTLSHLLTRMYELDSGKIKIDGVDIRELKTSSLREQIGVVLQKPILFSGTVKDNITYGFEDKKDEEIKLAADIALASEFVDDFEKKYEHEVAQKGANLSGGQKQRISIARALIKNPKILIMDDSTSAVDAGSESKIQKGLRTFAKDTTCIIITQKISSLKDADRIMVIDDGHLDGIGTHEELIKSSEVYKEIYSSQVGEEVELNGKKAI